jgi:cell division protein ZapB
MLSSRPEKSRPKKRKSAEEPYDINQLGLDFTTPAEYSGAPRKEVEPMNINNELIETLESRVNDLVEKYCALKEENARLNEIVQRFSSERDGLKSRVDAILGKLEGI